jgi:Recombination directionality factor-like
VSPTPLIELQRRLSEAGRIRMGEKGPKGEPRRLTTWRLTSPDENLIQQAADLYGGSLEPWESPTGPQYQLTTTSAELPVLVLVNYSLRQQYEYRTSPTLVERRCDGIEMEDGQPCLCATEDGDDKCDLVTRLTVALPELTTLLGWRLESKGENAARELLGSLELIQNISAGRPLIPAKLRIVERRGNVNGQAVRYVVPVLDASVSYLDLAGGGRKALEAPQGHIPAVRPGNGVALAEALEATEHPQPRSTRTAPIPASDELGFVDVPVPVPSDEPGGKPVKATAAQRKQLDVLVGKLRDADRLHTEHLYLAVAKLRDIEPGMLESVNDGSELHWGPLRDTLSKAEASNLIERLKPLEAAAAKETA